MKRLFNTKNLLIALYIAVAFLGGFVFGLRMGYIDGSQHTDEIRNQMLDIKPYDASLLLNDLTYYDISPSGCTIEFNTSHHPKPEIDTSYLEELLCQWTIYPSDCFYTANVTYPLFSKCLYRAKIETYPEGGTLMFRIIDKNLPEINRGSLWFYIDLPRSDDPNAILPPPYMPTGDRK